MIPKIRISARNHEMQLRERVWVEQPVFQVVRILDQYPNCTSPVDEKFRSDSKSGEPEDTKHRQMKC